MSAVLLQLKKKKNLQSLLNPPGRVPQPSLGTPRGWWVGWCAHLTEWIDSKSRVRVGFSLNMSRRETERVWQLEMAGEGPRNQREGRGAGQITSLTFLSCSEDHFELVSAEPWWGLPFVFYAGAVLFPKTLIKGHYTITGLALVADFQLSQ